MTKEAFSKIKILVTKNLSIKVKKVIIKTLVWSVLLYGSESWTLRKEDMKRLEACEMWIWRRIQKISYTEHVSNQQVLDRIECKREILDKIRNTQKRWIGHVLRGNNLLKI